MKLRYGSVTGDPIKYRGDEGKGEGGGRNIHILREITPDVIIGDQIRRRALKDARENANIYLQDSWETVRRWI